MTEAELRDEVKILAYRLGWIVFELPRIKARRPVKNAVGYPDLTLARDGQIMWLELKAEGGVMSEDQWGWWNALQPFCHIIFPEQWYEGRVAELLA
jgi:hypothetical protein